MGGNEPTFLGGDAEREGAVARDSAGERDPRPAVAPPPAHGERDGADRAVSPAARARRSSPRRAAPVFLVGGFWRRAAAAVVDAVLVVPTALGLGWLAGALAGVQLPAARFRGLDLWLDLLLTHDPAMIGILGLLVAIGVIYLLLFQVTLGQTPGMRLLDMRIIDIYGDPPSVGRSIARTVGYLASFATLSLGFLWIGVDSERRGLHDWIAGTYVVKA